MPSQTQRISKIQKIILVSKEQAKSVSEIHNEIFDRYHIDVTRKTIERDLEKMLGEKSIMVEEGYPKRFYTPSDERKIHLELTLDELELVKSCLGQVRNSNLIKSKLLSKIT